MDEPEVPAIYKKRNPSSPRALLAQMGLLLVGLAVVLGSVLWLFGRVAFENRSRQELFAQVLSGRPELRTAAAHEWLHALQKAESEKRDLAELRPNAAQSEALGQALLASDTPTGLRAATALLLSYASELAPARAPLRQYLGRLNANLQEAGDTQSWAFALLALGRLAEASDAEILLPAAGAADASLRKATAYALGLLPHLGERSRSTLLQLLNDSEADVRWNAAFALARHKDGQGAHVIADLLAQLRKDGSHLSAERLELYKNTLHAAHALQLEPLQRELRTIAHEHPHLKLRQLAKELTNNAARH